MRKFQEEQRLRRQQKITHLIRNELHEVLQREVKDPRLRSLTITNVYLKPDLKTAEVSVCKFIEGTPHEPSQEEKARLMTGLKSAEHYIYEQLKRRLCLRVIPSIRFKYDVTLAGSTQVWGVLDNLKKREEVQ